MKNHRISKPGSAGRPELEAGCALWEKGQYSAAVRKFQQAAQQGCAEAQVNLANALDEGQGVKENFGEARRLYKLAARSGLPESAFNLALAYRRRGIGRWERYWLETAARMGDSDAKQSLRHVKALKQS